MTDPVADRARLARTLAEEAGALARDWFARIATLKIESKGPQDVVTEADRAVEAFLRRRIADAFPGDGLIGEEHGREAGTSGFTWILDPIDGTANFVAGIPCWCVVIAVAEGERTVGAAIRDPSAGETFHARRGGGAFLGDHPLTVSDATDLGAGSIGVGHSTRVAAATAVRAVELTLDAGGMYYRNASGALMLAYVAAGRLLGYMEPHMNAWDCAAAMLLIEEAGGRVAPVDGATMLATGGPAIAGAPGVYEAVLSIAETAYGPSPAPAPA